MINLKSILLLSLVSFSLQDSHCLKTFSICQKKSVSYETGPIEHCISYDSSKEKCYACEGEYVVSSKQNSCLNFPNCKRLDSEDKKCEECYNFYLPNKEGKCERTLCASYNKDYGCSSCYDESGYYLKGTECKKIPIAYCDKGDENSCTTCANFAKKTNDGKCELRNLIEGCDEYNDDGTCNDCADDYEISSDGKKCNFKECDSKTENKVNYCGTCDVGYFIDDKDGKCIGIDGSKDSSSFNKVRYELIIFILSLLI